MRADRQLAMSALAFLFFAEGQRVWFGSLFGLAYEAVFPALSPGALFIALLPLLALLAPFAPLARRFDRDVAVATALAGIAVFRFPLGFPDPGIRVLFASLVVACGGLYLTWAVGHLEGRAVAAGAVVGLVADQLLRLAGLSWDLSLRPGWLPVQGLLTLALLGLVLVPARTRANRMAPAGDRAQPDGAPGLERRSGGLRLRGALALGGLLFLDLHLLGLPPVIARWTGVSWEAAGVAVSAASGIALAAALVGRGPVRSRALALGLVVVLAGGLAVGPWIEGVPGAILLAAGHGAALLLVARALNPASGRRGPGVVAAGLITFALGTAAYAATFFHAFLFPALRGGAPWIIGGAVVLVGASFLLLPQPPAWPRRLGVGAGVLVAAAVPTLGAALAAAAPGVPAAGQAGSGGAAVTVATYNIHFGYDEGWRFDPGSIAATLASAAPDIVALQEVPVGLPTAYNVDFPLWLERRLGLRAFFAPNTNGLQGEAILAGVEAGELRAVRLPPEHGDPKQLVHLPVRLGDRTVAVYALHLSVEEDERVAQMAASLAHVGAGPAILLGDLNALPGSRELAPLEAGGFRDAFEAAGSEPGGTWPARVPEMRIDWIWLRGIDAVAARVLNDTPSDHRLVAATLRVEPLNGH